MKVSDPHSFARPDEAIVTHLDLNLDVDFKHKILTGTAILTIENKTGTDTLYLDTRDLAIYQITLDTADSKIYEGSAHGEVSFELGKPIKYLGQELRIPISPYTKKVIIEYTTLPSAAALQWLLPEQTAGKKFPFLFTQSQAILARTWVPIQDSPGIRFTYSARVKVPSNLMAVMSAENPKEKSADGVYHFKMPQPIPAYLLALAVGDLVFKPFDNRTGVYAEPVTIDKAVYEFADLPKMVDAAEKLYGPYQWGQYDLIILPPSFPFGGMENPRLTFCTPTILAGDRSLTSLVAHELAHSWSGNLVTNATWNDFWLNEGFTVYFENRIMEALYGKEVADMLRILGQEKLKETIGELIDTAAADTHLKLELKGRDPDEGVTDVAYEKGCNLLMLIEQTVGREKLDAFLNSYFKKYSFQSVSTEQFIEEYKTSLIGNDSVAAQKIDLDKWIFGAGLPDTYVKISSTRFEAVDKTAEAWKNGTPPARLDTKNYTTNEWLRFLDNVPDSISKEKMKELDATFHFTQSGNSEILKVWLQHAVASGYEPAYPALENFLVHVGRRKFVKPLYTALIKTPAGTEMAKKIYSKARPNYHSMTRGTVDEILKVN